MMGGFEFAVWNNSRVRSRINKNKHLSQHADQAIRAFLLAGLDKIASKYRATLL